MKLILVFIVATSCFFVHAEDAPTFAQEVEFVCKFIDRINDDTPFSIEDQKFFLGDIGGLGGACLYAQLGVLDQRSLELKATYNFSPIGLLLQMKKDIFFPKNKIHGPLYFYKTDQAMLETSKVHLREITPNWSYIFVVGWEHNAVLEIDNEISMCLFIVASDKQGGLRIELSGSMVNGKTVFQALGFVKNDKCFAEMAVDEITLEQIKNAMKVADKN